MKRDMDLARAILLEIEKAPLAPKGLRITVPGRSEEETYYHLLLLEEAGLIHAIPVASFGDKVILPMRLTWEGHEFLDNAKDDTRWAKALEVGRQAGGFGLDILKEVLKELAKSAAEGAVRGMRQ